MRTSRRAVLGLVLTVCTLPLRPAAATSAPAAAASPTPVLRWNGALLDAIRSTRTPPTNGARALAIADTCLYDAWAAYDPLAVGTRLGATLRRPPEERTLEAKNEAISRAGRLALTDLFPALAGRFDTLLAAEGYDPAEPPADGTPAGVAVRACRAVVDFRHHDGSNQLGDEPGSSGGPYSDYTGYRPVNGPDHLSDPDRWQPQRVPDGHGASTVQQFLTPQWGRVVPFAAGEGDLIADPGPARAGTPPRRAEVDEMVRLSAGLTDEQKVIAEYWADGPGSELPPGHWMRFAEFCSRRDALGVDSDVKLYFLLANAMLDASVAVWDRKVRFDAVRPLHPTPATLAAAETSSWAYAFVIGALLLFAAAIIAGWLLRPHREQPHPGELTATDEAVDRPVEEGVPVPQYAAAAEPGAAGPSPDFCIRAMARSGCHG